MISGHIRDRIIDIVIGVTVGVVFSQVVFPVRVYAEFSKRASCLFLLLC